VPDPTAASGAAPPTGPYGRDYQLGRLAKYRDRANNDWSARIELVSRLTDEHILPRLRDREPSDIVVVDVGCSIGTFAVEFARRGFRTYGVDFDRTALDVAEELAREEGVRVDFVCDDVADWGAAYPPIDIAVCVHVFEHLFDDQLGALLASLRRQMAPAGALVWATFPSQYDHIFYGRDVVRWPLVPFAGLSPATFERLTKAYAALVDAGLVLAGGKTFKERIAGSEHPNPLTLPRVADILTRAGWENLHLGSGQLHPYRSDVHRRFAKQPVVHRNLWGVAVPGSPADS
jgi:2-polyprenyl-3-methyl-5-hydroxy-6-metoxy-1,4-benzoquinol methylase